VPHASVAGITFNKDIISRGHNPKLQAVTPIGIYPHFEATDEMV
jgi:hypothetical protein